MSRLEKKIQVIFIFIYVSSSSRIHSMLCTGNVTYSEKMIVIQLPCIITGSFWVFSLIRKKMDDSLPHLSHSLQHHELLQMRRLGAEGQAEVLSTMPFCNASALHHWLF